MKKQILLVEDDTGIARHIIATLDREHYAITHLRQPSQVAPFARDINFDAIILDRLVDREDAAASIDAWRASGIDAPVLMLSLLAGSRDRIDALKAGADACLAKPFEPDELEAKVRALIRMRERYASGNFESILLGRLLVDRRRREARCEGKLIALHPREFKLLEELALHPGEIVTRSTLLEKVWNLRFDPRTKLIESHVSRLRAKLDFAGLGDAIVTVRGTGYRLCAGGDAGVEPGTGAVIPLITVADQSDAYAEVTRPSA